MHKKQCFIQAVQHIRFCIITYFIINVNGFYKKFTKNTAVNKTTVS